jgi:hypothetical protein
MAIRFCRDCANFEDRRDIDGTVLCAKNMESYVCCEEFEPRDGNTNANRLYNRFCVECANFEDINGIVLCAKNHTPGVACDGFDCRFEKLNVTRQNNHMKTALIAHILNGESKKDSILNFVIEIARRINW